MLHYKRLSYKLNLIVIFGIILFLSGCGNKNEIACPDGDNPFQYTCIRYNGTDYYWHNVFGIPAEDYDLPEGFSYAGDVTEYCTTEDLTEDFQMYAPFEITASIYASKEQTDRIYVRATTDWIDDQYVVFTIPDILGAPL